MPLHFEGVHNFGNLGPLQLCPFDVVWPSYQRLVEHQWNTAALEPSNTEHIVEGSHPLGKLTFLVGLKI
eukprot:m.22674 g.22674  ORF g.22674 m.22674 type:complete len:69 (+) comp13900_c0_seq1:870-1076(+)